MKSLSVFYLLFFCAIFGHAAALRTWQFDPATSNSVPTNIHVRVKELSLNSDTGLPGNLALHGTNDIKVLFRAPSSNSIAQTNIIGVLNKASAAVIVLDCNDGNNFQITNSLAQDTSLIVTNLAQGQTITVSGAADGTSRVVTVVPKLGYLVRDYNTFGVAAAASKAITVTNNYAFEISIEGKWGFGTNFADVIAYQASNYVAGAVYTASSIFYDGTNDNVTFSGSAITFSEGKNLTVAVAIRPNVTNAVKTLVQARSGSIGGQWRLNQTVAGGIQFYATDTNNIQCVIANTSLSLISTGAWNTVYVTVDTANSANCKIFINGSDTSVSWTLVNTNMALNRTHLYMGTDDSNGGDFDGSESHLWIHNQTMAPATYHSAFFSGLAPVDVGSDGSTPGVTPGVYMKFTSGSLGVNSGSLGGTGTLNGPPISGPTFP